MESKSSDTKKRLVVAISGASGAQLGIELLKSMHNYRGWETHLVISNGGAKTIGKETKFAVKEVETLATKVYPVDNIGASIASGTFQTEGMVVIPCSMKTVAGIASGFSENLLLRAADVTIKERRPLILVTREAPLNSIHLRNLYYLSQLGVIILPPVLSFYNHPATVDDLVKHIVGKVLDIFSLDFEEFKRYE